MVSFSVIVPIYNGEKYISRAVESVLSQSYPAKEIILIDDGSKDGSYKKCTELAEAHSEIRCIHKENSGVSETRNLGMSIAVSDYIVFLDCDDYLPGPNSAKRSAPAFLIASSSEVKRTGETMCLASRAGISEKSLSSPPVTFE